MKKIITYLSFAINNIIILGLISLFVVKGPTWVISKIKGNSTNANQILTQDDNNYYTKQSIYSTLDKQYDNNIVFFGDSLTENGDWNELFDNSNILNRGIGGDTTNGMLKRISEIKNLKPKKLFIMAGINDLSRNNTVNQVSANYEKIVEYVKKNSPATQIYIQSTLPINNSINTLPIKPTTIKNLNDNLKYISDREGATFIDLYSHLVDNNNQLQKKYTHDGLHLNGEGYLIWKNVINKYVAS
jgi:lysophospholipase L1-like esterase